MLFTAVSNILTTDNNYNRLTCDPPELNPVRVPQEVADVATGVRAQAMADAVYLGRVDSAELHQLRHQASCHGADEPRVGNSLRVRRPSAADPVDDDHVAVLSQQQLLHRRLRTNRPTRI